MSTFCCNLPKKSSSSQQNQAIHALSIAAGIPRKISQLLREPKSVFSAVATTKINFKKQGLVNTLDTIYKLKTLNIFSIKRSKIYWFNLFLQILYHQFTLITIYSKNLLQWPPLLNPANAARALLPATATPLVNAQPKTAVARAIAPKGANVRPENASAENAQSALAVTPKTRLRDPALSHENEWSSFNS